MFKISFVLFVLGQPRNSGVKSRLFVHGSQYRLMLKRFLVCVLCHLANHPPEPAPELPSQSTILACCLPALPCPLSLVGT